MCGIVGVFAFNNKATKEEESNRRKAMSFLFTEILQETVERGKDATGVSALYESGKFMLKKSDMDAADFIASTGMKEENYDTFTNFCTKYDERLKVMVGHCRKTSVGNTFNNANNHPIKANNIIGVHNGTLTNHNRIFKELACERDGMVDSEAIMRLMDYSTNYGKDPFTIDSLEYTACRLDGTYSVIAYNAYNPYQVALMRKGRPMELVLIKPLNLLIVASDDKYIDAALYNFNKYSKIYGLDLGKLYKKDTVCLTFPTDNIGVVDLTQEINEDTVMSDVINKKDVFKNKKYWQTDDWKNRHNAYGGNANSNTYNKGNTTGNKNASGANTNNANTNGTNNTGNTSKASGGVNTGKKQQKSSKVFCKELQRYVSEEELAKWNDTGNVQMNTLSGKETPIGNSNTEDKVEDNSKPLLTVSSVLDYEESIDPVPIEVFTNSEDTKPSKEDLEVDINILKGSEEHANALKRFENDEEVAEFLEIVSHNSLTALSIHALANRIRRAVYSEGFIDGALFYKEVVEKEGTRRAVRIAKDVVNMLGHSNSELLDGDKIKHAEVIKNAIEKYKREELTSDTFRKVFSKGDILKNKSLHVINTLIGEADGK